MVSKSLGQSAVDDAFKAQINLLFSVLCRGLVVDDNKAAHAAFRKGLAVAIAAHEEADAAIEELTSPQ